jgi:type 1 fimbria pilin
VKLASLLASLTVLALAGPSTADAAGTRTVSGTIGKSACKYTVTAEWSL